jgi:hypothetical protein
VVEWIRTINILIGSTAFWCKWKKAVLNVGNSYFEESNVVSSHQVNDIDEYGNEQEISFSKPVDKTNIKKNDEKNISILNSPNYNKLDGLHSLFGKLNLFLEFEFSQVKDSKTQYKPVHSLASLTKNFTQPPPIAPIISWNGLTTSLFIPSRFSCHNFDY